MAFVRQCLLATFLLTLGTNALPAAGNTFSNKRRASGPTVDLEYEVYQGFFNSTTGINNFLGIRYAQSTEGKLRWQAPQQPLTNRGSVIQATEFPQRCPQGSGAPAAPPGFNFTGTEDCLFLSVQAPANASSLPVLVWIHGGGYNEGQGNQDLTAIMQENNNGFIGVSIQYRLSSFGFLSSDEVSRYGTPNAGLLDQHFALEWVQKYISLFGGDPARVTISGESAGGGSVMLQAMAYGGTEGTSLFNNIISASPYLPMQYGYADFVPSQSYYAFAATVGCFDDMAFGNMTGTIFECLVGKDTETLQNANNMVSSTSAYGTWAFLPVTDGKFIQQLPSQQLLKNQVNGVRTLVGNNANEGPGFVPQNILTESDFEAYVRQTFPLFTDDDIAEVLTTYPSSTAPVNPSDPEFATNGVSGATAINESTFGTGQQQRADNLYAETTFVCPSYWLAEAYATSGRLAYKYQHSVIGAQHGADVAGYFGPVPANFGPDYEKAFMTIWGNFVIADNPSIPNEVANGAASTDPGASNPASAWPAFSFADPMQIDLNQTGGTPFETPGLGGANLTIFVEPGLVNDITLVDAFAWEGGRGVRCEFWRKVGVVVPEK